MLGVSKIQVISFLANLPVSGATDSGATVGFVAIRIHYCDLMIQWSSIFMCIITSSTGCITDFLHKFSHKVYWMDVGLVVLQYFSHIKLMVGDNAGLCAVK